MASMLMAGQLILAALLIFLTVVLSWHAGVRFWSK